LAFHKCDRVSTVIEADETSFSSERALENLASRRDCDLYSTVTTLICRLEQAAQRDTDVIEWGSPVPSFGDISTARVATVGLNPSNREFVDNSGHELCGAFRRFQTLSSLGIASWLDTDTRHLRLIIRSCERYFTCNPYDTWFRRLDHIASGGGFTFYGPQANLCHLDLIPFATSRKWTELSPRQRSSLLSIAADTLALLLRESPIEALVLNGRAVVEHFQMMAGIRLETEEIPGWALQRRGGAAVSGYGFSGRVREIAGIPLDRDLLILGYNHNLQSSFGITREVMTAIRGWLSGSLRAGGRDETA
jgi:hypothetical protein